MLRASAFAIATALVAWPTALAQEPGQTGLEEIVVTAERRETRLQETPIAVTALSEGAIEDLQIEQTQDVAKAVPNLQLLPVTANPSVFQVGLRGGSEQAGGLVVSEPVVGVYVDDVYIARLQGANAQLTDVERIEVLRGPQGTLYGRNMFSGAIKFVTRTPSAEKSWANASIGYGEFEEVKLTGSVGGPIADNFGASVAVLYRDQNEGWIFNRATNQTVGAEENFALRGKLAYDAGPWTAVASLDYGKDENDGFIPVSLVWTAGAPGQTLATRRNVNQSRAVTGFDRYVTSSPTPSRGETEQWGASLNVAREFDAVTLRSITAYRSLDDLFRWDLTGGFQIGPSAFISGFDRTAIASASQFTQEVQALGEAMDGKLDWIAGLYFLSEEGEQTFDDRFVSFFLSIPGPPSIVRLPPFAQSTETKSYAAFGQATWSATDKLSFTAGLRYTQDEKSFRATIAAPTNLAVAIDADFDAWTPKLGVDYKFTDAIFGYASISRGFKAGGFNGLDRNPAVLRRAFDPQLSTSYEVGLKADWFDSRLRTNVAVFVNDLEDLQQVASAGGGAFPTQNVGDARLTGFEAEIAASPIEGLTLFGNFGVLDDEYQELNPGASAATAGAIGLPLVAETTAQLGANYTFPLTDRYRARIGADARYVGNYFVNVQNNLEAGDYWRSDAFVSLGTENGKWEVALEGRNLTDEETYVSGALVDALTILKPRTWMLSVRYKR
jgi:iron complex outermembrane receptor protein